jgi:hypothetical protein
MSAFLAHPACIIGGVATCMDCDQEMLTAQGCTVSQLTIGGAQYARNRCTRDRCFRGRCGDCGAARGGFHHLGCDLEPCPRCGRQLISCGCWTDGIRDDD